VLAPGADLYIGADVEGARPILDGLSLGSLGGAELSDFLDRSRSLSVAVYGGGPRRFLAAAFGKYPGGGGLFFGARGDWEKARSASGIPYWRSEKRELSVYLNSARVFVSDGDPFVPPPGAESPRELVPLKEGAVLSGWMENPGPPLSRIAAALGVPVEIPAERLIFAVYPADGRGEYRAVLRLETANPSRAGALARLFTFAKAALSESGPAVQSSGVQSLVRIFFTENPGLDGSAVVLKTGVLKSRDFALLFNTLTVYSR
jgi:hypothetical protein